MFDGEPRVVDTNVLVIANGEDEPSPKCVMACVSALRGMMNAGSVVVDDGWEILREYLRNARPNVQPGVGNAFLKWVLTNQANPERVERVKITPGSDDPTLYAELPAGAHAIDPSDRKFVAVAASHPERPPILQALDSKWWGYTGLLAEHGIVVEFLCPEDIEEKYRQKMGAR